MWLAIYFGILSLGSSLACFAAPTNAEQIISQMGDPEHYRKLASQALVLAGISIPERKLQWKQSLPPY
jgi:hypothetical protein